MMWGRRQILSSEKVTYASTTCLTDSISWDEERYSNLASYIRVYKKPNTYTYVHENIGFFL